MKNKRTQPSKPTESSPSIDLNAHTEPDKAEKCECSECKNARRLFKMNKATDKGLLPIIKCFRKHIKSGAKYTDEEFETAIRQYYRGKVEKCLSWYDDSHQGRLCMYVDDFLKALDE